MVPGDGVGPLLIGLAGGSCAGKSVLARALASRFGEATVVELDSYYLDRSGLTPADRELVNYDEPAAIEADLLIQHLRALAAGTPVLTPCYSFETHLRTGTARVVPSAVVIVDGLFTLWWRELRECLDLKVFVDAPSEVRLARRIERDVATRGRAPESVLEQYRQTVQPMYERYVAPTRGYADIVVENTAMLEASLGGLIVAIGAARARIQRDRDPGSREEEEETSPP